MPIKSREIIHQLARCVLTAVAIWLLLLVSAAGTAVLSQWLIPATDPVFWFKLYATAIAPLTAIVITIWLWLLENYYD